MRHFEQFTALHLGLLAETRRKTLPRLGKAVHADPQALHHFLANAEWSGEALRQRRLELLRQAVGQTPFIRCLDETGDRKKGHTTDDVATHYIGNRQTLANGIVSVNAYGVLGTTTFPLLFRLFKPQTRRKAGDVYQTKPQLAIEMIEELLALGFRCSVVLADSLYGDSGPFSSALHRLRLPYVVAIRSSHGVWLLPGQRVRRTRWRSFERVFTDGTSQERFIRETVFGTRRAVRYYQYQITTDPRTLPPETTWDLHDQPVGCDRADGRQHLRVTDLGGVRLQTREGRPGLGRLAPHRLRQHRTLVGAGHEGLYAGQSAELRVSPPSARSLLHPHPPVPSSRCHFGQPPRSTPIPPGTRALDGSIT